MWLAKRGGPRIQFKGTIIANLDYAFVENALLLIIPKIMRSPLPLQTPCSFMVFVQTFQLLEPLPQQGLPLLPGVQRREEAVEWPGPLTDAFFSLFPFFTSQVDLSSRQSDF